MKKAIILLSGGLDSTTTLAIARSEGYDLYALTFLYGQRNEIELAAAKRVVKFFPVKEHKIIHLDLRALGGSSLTGEGEIPKDRVSLECTSEIKVDVCNTYVPARNTIFLSYALAYAEVIKAHDIFIGVNARDYSSYPDCRPEYISAFQQLANLATVEGIMGTSFRIHAPLMEMNKSQIIRKGCELGVEYGLTHTCYDPVEDLACGHCDACLFRKKGFREALVLDPTRYASV